MCVTAIIAGASLLMSAVGTYTQIQANNANKDYAQWQAKQQVKELKIDTELNKIAALEQENQRGREFQRNFGESMAAITASGVAEHISFFQGVAPENFDRFSDEIRAIRLNMVHSEARNERQIGVVKYGSVVAGYNAKMQNMGAIAGFMQDAMSAFSFYKTNSVPAKPAPAGGG